MPQEELIESKAEGTNYEPIIPKIREWPIAQLYQNKKEFEEDVIQETLAKIFEESPTAEKLETEIARAYYSEIQRIRRTPWKVDKPDEKDFWESLKKDTNEFEINANNEEKLKKYKEVIEIIVRRYTEEISATFDPKAYHFAKRFLSFGFASLLNAFQAKNVKAIFDHKIFIQDRIKLYGEIDKIRELAKRGTIILLPTHFSNLDSIIVGWGIHAIGLPAFIYGAGLNLYNSKLVGYFMNRLGAYKVDRRKKNPFYLETLKIFSKVSLEKGCHSLFFPGGTRSRSGAIEDKLKLGLLGTAFETQRENIEKSRENNTEAQKIFIVPLVMSYHFVLEAKSLIRQHLKTSEAEKYYFNRKDEFSSKKKVLSFIHQLLKKKSEIFLSFGRPMDLFGNEVDEEGNSIFKGKKVDIATYFESNGKISDDPQRDNVYTRDLGNLIAQEFLKYNIVLSSHIVAFVTFQLLLKRLKVSDVYGLFEFEAEELVIPREEFLDSLDRFLQILFEKENAGELICSPDLRKPIVEVMQDGVKNTGIFHNNKPLIITKEGDVTSDDLELLYYYHNRMKGYDLKKFI